MEEQTNINENTNWLQAELDEVKSKQTFDGEKKPALILEENKITEFDVDVSQPWEKWYDEENKTTKKIIPCKVAGVEHIWWLNVKNPIYSELVQACADGKTRFKVMQIGKGKSTKYNFVKD